MSYIYEISRLSKLKFYFKSLFKQYWVLEIKKAFMITNVIYVVIKKFGSLVNNIHYNFLFVIAYNTQENVKCSIEPKKEKRGNSESEPCVGGM